MILLTDEELAQAKGEEECADIVREYGECGECSGNCKEIAKAQLKKVAEYLQKRWNGTEYEFYNIVAIPKDDWQSLLEETK